MISTREEESFLLLFFSCIEALYENRQKYWLLAEVLAISRPWGGERKKKKADTSLFIGNIHFFSFGKRF